MREYEYEDERLVASETGLDDAVQGDGWRGYNVQGGAIQDDDVQDDAVQGDGWRDAAGAAYDGGGQDEARGAWRYDHWIDGRPVEQTYGEDSMGRQPGTGAYSQRSLQAYRNRGESRYRFTALTLAACMIIGSVFGFFGAYAYNQVKAARGETGGAEVLYQSVVRKVAAGDADSELTMIETAAMVKETVVEINTEKVTTYGRYGQRLIPGAGSGIIISKDGYIATNYHVINDAENIMVRLPDGRAYTATVIGSDSDSDLAVIKIPVSGLTPAILGDSAVLQVGQTTLAVGNPLGELGGTVTSGIISALDREVTFDDGQVMTLLQTDAAINPGNSGGGLFNLYGELIGVVNAKSTGVDVEGLGFAIPVNTAKKVVEDIIAIGYVRGRVSAGLEVISVETAREAMMYKVNQTGLYIAASKDSRLQAGDRIIGVNDTPVNDFASFKGALSKFKVGDVVNITVDRDSRQVTVGVTLTELKP